MSKASSRMLLFSRALFGVGAIFMSLQSGAQGFPSRPIKLIVPYPAGGSVDVLGRAVGERLQAVLGQPVVPENRTGATGTIAHQAIAKAPADGYTIGISGTSPLVLAPHQYRNLPYDPLKDFAYLSCAGTTPFVLDVHPGVPCLLYTSPSPRDS